jgi:cation:H+ antiporter
MPMVAVLNMSSLFQLLFLVGLFIMLGFSARWVIHASMAIGIKLRIGGFFTGFVILGLLTSTPEFLVAINSVAEGYSSLSLGNLLGASLVLITLVTGISILTRGEVCILCMVRRRTLALFSFVVMLPVLLALDGVLSTVDGFVLIATYIAYLLYMLSREHLYAVPAPITNGLSMRRSLAIFAVGAAVLIIASRFAVDIGRSLALETGISSLLIGLGIFSVGTNLPEIALALTARRASQRGFVFGDVLGSAAANTLIVGIVALLHPVTIHDTSSFLVAGSFLAVALILFSAFAHSDRRMKTGESIIMLAVYAAFLVAIIILGFAPEIIPVVPAAITP